MKRVLVIDANNMFIRYYIVSGHITTNGNPFGGVGGFIQGLQKWCREFKPDEIVICWDGAGGSARRKAKDNNYKAGRKPLRLNRETRYSEEEEAQNKLWQQQRLIEYLNGMPLIQFIFDGVEADDIIAVLARHERYKGWQKVILSSDKDFYQLCDEETIIYRPIQKQFMNEPRIVEDFGIHPKNFALARAMAGDRSDNLPGIGSVGLPTIAKRFPFFETEGGCNFDILYEHCRKVEKPLKVHTSVLEHKDVIEMNYNMMQLYVPNVPSVVHKKIAHTFQSFEPQFNKTGFVKQTLTDGLSSYNWNALLQTFNRITFNGSAST